MADAMAVEKDFASGLIIASSPQSLSYFASCKYAARSAISSSVKGFAIMIINAELGPFLIPLL
jgi:hypothetical protein